MKNSVYKILVFLLWTVSPFHLLAQSAVSNVRAMQEGRNVVLLYDLSKDTEILQLKIEVDGRSRVIPSSCLSGDVGKKVLHGTNRRIVYNVLSDYTSGLRSDNVYFVIEDNSTPMHNGHMHNGHEYVDLGLSVKWATCNVGASQHEEYGDYFAWGETEPKATYYWSTYKWCNDSVTTLTKYNTDSSYGTVDNKTQLDLSDDAAHVNWGGDWRMPTEAEWTELREQCTWTRTTQNGVKGYKVTSKKVSYSKNSIFLPAAGCRYDSDLSYAGSVGYYWSSSLKAGNPDNACDMYLDSSDVLYVFMYFGYRSCGRSVRPVCP